MRGPVGGYPGRSPTVTVHTLSLDDIAAERAGGTQDAAIIEIHTGAGITGIGEVDGSPPVVEAMVK